MAVASNPGNKQPADSAGEFMNDEVGEYVQFGRVCGQGCRIVLVKDVQENAREQEEYDDGEVHQSGYDDCACSGLAVFCSQHALDHVLVRPVCSHRDERSAQKRCPYRIFLSQNVGTLFQEAESFFRSPGKEFPVIPSVHDGGNGVPAAGNVGEQYPKGGEHGDAEYRRLQHVRPDDGFQTAYGRINGGGHADDDQRGDVKQDYLFGICRSIGDKLISNDKQNACKVEPGSAGQNPADQENHGGSAPGQQSEPFFQIFINGDYLIVVIRFEEELADDNAAQNRAYA